MRRRTESPRRLQRLGISVAALALGATVVAGCSDDAPKPRSGAKVPCAAQGVARGRLTVATGPQARAPWFEDEPSSGKGFESEVAYALAGELGYAPGKVAWVSREDGSPAAGFDLEINQFAAATLPPGTVSSVAYVTSGLALVIPAGSNVTTEASLASARLGLVGDVVDPAVLVSKLALSGSPTALPDADAAAAAFAAGSLDAVVMESSVALGAVNGGPLAGATIVGRLRAPTVPFVAAIPKASKLRTCVDRAIRRMHDDGTIDRLSLAYLGDLTSLEPVAR